jgi:hypothetical protein
VGERSFRKSEHDAFSPCLATRQILQGTWGVPVLGAVYNISSISISQRRGCGGHMEQVLFRHDGGREGRLKAIRSASGCVRVPTTPSGTGSYIHNRALTF